MMAKQQEPAFKTFERTGWEKCVDAYDNSFTPLTNKAGYELLRRLDIQPGEVVLDVACGPGHLTSFIAEKGARVTGADFSPAMLARARAKHPTITFDVQDAEALKYSGEAYDVVTMNFGMLHLGDPEKATAEAVRVLRPGGRFGFTVWAPPSEAVGFSVMLEAIQQHGDPHVTLPAGPPFFKYSDPHVASDLLQEAGLVSVVANRLNLTWELSSPQEYFNAFHMGTARTGGLLRAQSEHQLVLIREAAESAIRELYSSGKGTGLEIPMPVMVYTAERYKPSLIHF